MFPFTYPAPSLPETYSYAGLAEAAKRLARENGFDLAGVSSPVLGAAYHRYLAWLAHGYAGEMAYLARNASLRGDLRRLWPETCSVLIVGMRYNPPAAFPEHEAPASGRIARYAHGGDYHKFMKKRLVRVLRGLKEIDPGIEGRSFVDTGPILERDVAVQSGLGWKGKNSLLLHRDLGSYFFLGTLLLNRPLPPEPPFKADHCGTCNRCIDACPTDAIVASGVVDASRCISYLTIELRGPMPRELRPLVGNHIFGCDICQEVCPWNEDAPAAAENRFAPRPALRDLSLRTLLGLDAEAFTRKFQGTAVMRARYAGFLRNVAVAIGNSGGGESLPALITALAHREALVRGHAAWAIGRIARRVAAEWTRFVLEGRLEVERDEWVREEIELALGNLSSVSLPVIQRI